MTTFNGLYFSHHYTHYNGILRHAFLRVGEDISMQHFISPSFNFLLCLSLYLFLYLHYNYAWP